MHLRQYGRRCLPRLSPGEEERCAYMPRSTALEVAAPALLARASRLVSVVRIPLQCNGFGRLAVAHPRRRDWTLADLDRDREYWLRYDPSERRWVLLSPDDDGQWQRFVTVDEA